MAQTNGPSGAWRCLVAAALSAAMAPSALPAAEAATDSAETVILAAGGYWRQHVTLMPPLVSARSAKAAGMKPDEAERVITLRSGRARIISAPTSPPPAEWPQPGFDDMAWELTRGGVRPSHEMGLICRRGKFVVPRPGGVRKLTLEIGYCGGVAAQLNGREVLRKSLPAGPLTARTPGEDYGEEAFFVSDGPRKGKLLHHYTDRERTEQFALRRRRAGPVELPVGLLRKGVNVLALEMHSSNYPAGCRKAGMGGFSPVGVAEVFLRAECEAGAIVPAVARPEGFHVWNADVAEEVTELSFPPPGEPLRPMRIAALRNGRFSGQVVVGSTSAIAGLAARAGELTGPGGVIPATAVEVRYGRAGRLMRYLGGHVYGGPTGADLGVQFRRFDALLDAAAATVPPIRPAEKLRAETRRGLGLPAAPVAGAVVPIWLTVRVPADAAAGAYTGRLILSADGHQDVPVPVELEVFDWAPPPPAERASELSVYQSPDTLAAHYKVPLWSDAHWGLIERSVRLIGEAGNHTIILPLLSKEQVGNEESYVRWVRQPDGSFAHDAAVLERYLDVYLRHHDRRRIQAVCCIVWGNAGVAQGNPYQKAKYDDRGLPKATRGTFTVTALDPATGATSDMPLPPLGSQAYEDFWRPVLLAVRDGLRRRGLAEKMMLGMPADPPIPALVVRAFHNILPDVGWFVGNHPGASRYYYDRNDRSKTVPAVHVERVYTSAIPDPADKRLFGWRRKDMALAFNRYGFGPLCLFPDPRVWAFRILTEADLAGGHRGPGRIGADYWPMGLRTGSGGAGTFYARYPHSAIGQTGMASNCAALLAPGPDGPVTTVRFENVREGIQNAEAVAFIQKALLDGKLPEPLTEACWRALDERVNAIRVNTLGLGRAGWRQRDRRLYALAAEVAGRLRARAAGESSPRPAGE